MLGAADLLIDPIGNGHSQAYRRFALAADPRRFVTVRLGGGLMTAIVLQTGRRFAKRFPLGKIATLVAWFDEPLIFAGDAEDVFLTKN